MKQEQFERWLAGLPADLHDPAIRNRLIVAPTILGATMDSPTITGTEFVLPPAGVYALGLLTTGTVAATSHIHISAQLRRSYVVP